jgi:ParB-like chromosome segregation protein Spo0J
LLLAIVEQGLSVRATEKRVGQLNGSPPKKRSSAAPHYALAEELLTRQLGADVQIKARPRGGGRIVIRYSCEEELTQLVDRLGTEER